MQALEHSVKSQRREGDGRARDVLAASRLRAFGGVLNAGGNTLIGVLAVISAVLLVGTAIFTLGESEGDIVEYALDDARAFYIAEAGIERARAWLGDLETAEPGADPVGVLFENQRLGGGLYTVEVLDDIEGSWLPAYEIRSTGRHDDAVRQIDCIVIPETFARYQWFVEQGGWKWFQTGERFEGPVHVNGQLQIDGDPWFGNLVTAGQGITIKNDSYPTFERGYQLHVDEISLPELSYLESTLLAAAIDGGVYAESFSGNGNGDGWYAVELGVPAPGALTYTGYKWRSNGTLQTVVHSTPVEIAGINGAVWFGEDITIQGVLDGQLTIYADGEVRIWDDILYQGSTPGLGPDIGCDDVLGLIAGGDIVISKTTPNMHDCELHGVYMALEKEILAEKYQQPPPRGDLIIYGGLVADKSVHLGQFQHGECTSGYERDYRVDRRLPRIPPPFFPLTGKFIVYSWQEVMPPEA
jgi:hypothetical protein